MKSVGCKILLAFLLMSATLFAQETKEERIKKTIEQYAQSIDASADFTDLQTQLEGLYDNPIDLNTASREELSKLFLLTQIQINNLLAHIAENGKLISTLELQSIDGFELEDIERILPFISVDEQLEKPFWDEVKHGYNNIILRTVKLAETPAGYTNGKYPGSPFHLYGKYNFVASTRLSAGITADKDEGEEFFKGSQKQGFDFYSAHLFYTGKKLIRKIAVGDFQMQTGQGLVLWTGFAPSKTADATNVLRDASGLLPYKSAGEYRFMRGGAYTLALGKSVALTQFFSYKKIDANIFNQDTLTTKDDYFSSIYQSGYHRTTAELATKHQLNEFLTGGDLSYTKGMFKVGVSAMYGSYGIPFQPAKDSGVKSYRFSGKNFYNVGVNYRYLFRNIYFFGETAAGVLGSYATINGALISLHPTLQASIINRNYSAGYFAPYSNGFSEATDNTNEKGTYIGMQWKPKPQFIFNGYFDAYSFPWLKYLVSSPGTIGKDALIDFLYIPNKKFSLNLRFKREEKEHNISSSYNNTEVQLQTNLRQSMRAEIHFKPSPEWTLQSRVESVFYSEKTTATVGHGFLGYQGVAWQPMKKRYSITARYYLFDINDYNARIYAYEDDMPFVFSIPSFSGQGMKYYAVVSYKINRKIKLYAKATRTEYLNQNTIGSGNDLINAPHKTEFKLQMNIGF
ncbi:MAG: helix-hairpin-helix domain-containing protein [Bacteroidetes bacterium]|nr:helix-hairpin-helix domain-containing protein [Bacteroidota bacterium]